VDRFFDHDDNIVKSRPPERRFPGFPHFYKAVFRLRRRSRIPTVFEPIPIGISELSTKFHAVAQHLWITRRQAVDGIESPQLTGNNNLNHLSSLT